MFTEHKSCFFFLNLVRGAECSSFQRVDISRMQRSMKGKLMQYPKALVSYSESRKAAVVSISKKKISDKKREDFYCCLKSLVACAKTFSFSNQPFMVSQMAVMPLPG